MQLLVLGNSAAVPAHGRHLSAQILKIANRFLLIDCGEATQFQMQRYGVSLQKIERIFISHLHGDHLFGLPGLITSMNLLGRTKQLDVYAPVGIGSFLQKCFETTGAVIAFPLRMHELAETEDVVFEDEYVLVQAYPLKHRVVCLAYIFKMKESALNVRKEKIAAYMLDRNQIIDAKAGRDVRLTNGTLVPNGELTYRSKEAITYAYCTDTLLVPEIENTIRNASCLYHEATFAEDEIQKCTGTYHTTAMQAARLALQANCGSLLLGHFSGRYQNTDKLVAEARTIFKNTHASEEGVWYDLSAL